MARKYSIVRFTETFIVFVLFAVFVGCAPSKNQDVDCYCSILQLVANPDEFQGSLVQLKGFASAIGPEQDVGLVFLTQDDVVYWNRANSIFLDDSESDSPKTRDFDRFDGKYVLVEGEFRFKNGVRRVENLRRLDIVEPTKSH